MTIPWKNYGLQNKFVRVSMILHIDRKNWADDIHIPISKLYNFFSHDPTFTFLEIFIC